MEPEGSSSYSQESATFSYSEPDQSSPYPHFTSWRSILIISFHLLLGFSSGLFASGLSHQNPVWTSATNLKTPSSWSVAGIWTPAPLKG